MKKGISEHLLCAMPCRDLGAGLKSASCPLGFYDRQGEASTECPAQGQPQPGDQQRKEWEEAAGHLASTASPG